MATDRTAPGQATIEATEWKHGWPTVLAAAIGYGAGPLLFITTASVFIRPAMQATGWSTTEVLIAPFVAFLFSVLGPLAGRVADRTSPRRTVAGPPGGEAPAGAARARRSRWPRSAG